MTNVTFDRKKDEDQNYRQVSEIDTDIFIVGRGIYESTNIKDTIQSFLYM
jgi:3-keto-L-gulonate-6-phosphate decarboxylase